MNKAITVMLILVGVLLILLFPSLHLESGNIILFLISVFVIGFFAGGFANLDNITKANQDNVFYQREVGRKNAIIQDITRERDNYRLEHDNRREDTEALIKLKHQKEAILRQATTPELREIAIKEGFQTMQDMGRRMIANGELSFREFERVLGSD